MSTSPIAYNSISALPFQHSSWILFYLPLRTRDCYEVLNDSQQPQHLVEARCPQTGNVAASPFQLAADAHHFRVTQLLLQPREGQTVPRERALQAAGETDIRYHLVDSYKRYCTWQRCRGHFLKLVE